jgi:hypothetical protein
MTTILRTMYRGLLRLHPVDFRAEFGEEMLWIFDEECKRGAALALIVDGVRSIVVQNLRPRLQPQCVETAGPYYHEIDSSLPAERIAQAWLIALSCTLSLTLFMSMMVPGVAMPIGRLLYTSVRGTSSAPVVPHRNALWRHRPQPFTNR